MMQIKVSKLFFIYFVNKFQSGTNWPAKQGRLRRACESVHACHSLCCSQSMDVDEDSGKKLDL